MAARSPLRSKAGGGGGGSSKLESFLANRGIQTFTFVPNR